MIIAATEPCTPQSTGQLPPPSTPAPCPAPAGERRILRLAAGRAAGLPADLREIFTGLGDRNLTLAISVFMHDSSQRPPHLEP